MALSPSTSGCIGRLRLGPRTRAQLRRPCPALRTTAIAAAVLAAPGFAAAQTGPGGPGGGQGSVHGGHGGFGGHGNDGGKVPNVFNAWLLDRDIRNPAQRTLDVQVLLTRDQLSDLHDILKGVLQTAEEGLLSPQNFLNELKSLAEFAHDAHYP